MEDQYQFLPERFDSFCKKVIKNEAINIQKQRTAINKKQINFSSLKVEDYQAVLHHSLKELIGEEFEVLGYRIRVEDDLLASVVNHLDDLSRKIILLSFFVGYSDKEIAAKLNIAYWKISYMKKKTLEEMRRLMG